MDEGVPAEAIKRLTEYLDGAVGTVEMIGYLKTLNGKSTPTVEEIMS